MKLQYTLQLAVGQKFILCRDFLTANKVLRNRRMGETSLLMEKIYTNYAQLTRAIRQREQQAQNPMSAECNSSKTAQLSKCHPGEVTAAMRPDVFATIISRARRPNAVSKLAMEVTQRAKIQAKMPKCRKEATSCDDSADM